MNPDEPMNRERGSISIVALVLAAALLGAAGLVIDGGGAASAAARASDIAQDAARAGIVAGGHPQEGGDVIIDPTTARDAVVGWLIREGIDPSNARITVDADAVTVRIRQKRPTNLLRLIGITHLNIEGAGAARPASGITKEGT